MKMYVVVREDLEPIYKMVQGAHALAGYMLEHGQAAAEWNNETLVFIYVKDEEKLFRLKNKLEYKGIKFHSFYEPDIGNQLTSIACYSEEQIFKNYQLVK